MTELFADQIPFLKPWLGEEEAAAVREVILSGWVSMGPRTQEFERAVADVVGAAHGVATNAATTSLHLALVVSGLEPGDEVVVPSFTCMATVNAIIMAGGRPRFADIEPRTFNLDPEAAEASLTPRTRGMVVVDQIGLTADIDAFVKLARTHDLVLIEDAATALGGRYNGRPVGGSGVPACFSFHPRKMITTGEGGMMVTDDAVAAERARVLRSTGASVSDLVRHQAKGVILQEYHEAGTNYRMTDMQAAMGLVQLGRLDEMLTARRAQARYYDEALAGIDGVEPPYVPTYAEHAYSSYCITLQSGLDPHEVVVGMAERGISTRHGIQPLHHEPYFRDEMGGLSLPETEAAAVSTMFLPIFPGLTESDQEQVVGALAATVRG